MRIRIGSTNILIKLIPVARHACALYHYRRERLPAGATTIDGFVDFRDWYRGHEDEAHDFLTRFDEGQVLKFLKSAETAREVRMHRVLLLHSR